MRAVSILPECILILFFGCRDDAGELRAAVRVRRAEVAHVLRVYRVLGVRGDVPGAAGLLPAGLEAPVRVVQRSRAPTPPHLVVR